MEAYEELEKTIETVFQARNVVSCSSGTAALHLAFEALQLPKRARVLVPEFTMIACPRSVTMADLEPVFIDCKDDLLMDLNLLEHALLKDTFKQVKAILVVHIYGRRVNVYAISDMLKRLNREDIHVVEDLAECHYCAPNKLTSAACWSFYKNKVIGGEEGGAVSFFNSDVAQRAKSLRSLGFTDKHDFNHIPRGHNYRMSNAHANLILEAFKLNKISLQWRRIVESEYDRTLPYYCKMPVRWSPWVYDLRIPGLTHSDQDRLIKNLKEIGVAARHAFKPMVTQEEYQRSLYYSQGIADVMSREVLYLPLKIWEGFDFPTHTQAKEFCQKAIDTVVTFC